jgi:spore maturation protein A
MNRIFALLLVAAALTALGKDTIAVASSTSDAAAPVPTLKAVTDGALEGASNAAKLALSLVGILAFWMGVLRVAERAGIVEIVASWARPVIRRLFPDVPAEHPAQAAMVMSFAANLLGLGNAATPLGIDAMKKLQTLNPSTSALSNAQVTFVVMIASGLTLIPVRTIAIRAEHGSTSSVAILLPTLLATAASTVAGVLVARALARRAAREDDGR